MDLTYKFILFYGSFLDPFFASILFNYKDKAKINLND